MTVKLTEAIFSALSSITKDITNTTVVVTVDAEGAQAVAGKNSINFDREEFDFTDFKEGTHELTFDKDAVATVKAYHPPEEVATPASKTSNAPAKAAGKAKRQNAVTKNSSGCSTAKGMYQSF